MNLQSLYTAIHQARKDVKHGSKIKAHDVTRRIHVALECVNAITLSTPEMEFENESSEVQNRGSG